jgi:acetyl-CoA synthetase
MDVSMKIHALLAEYGDPEIDLANVLCDRHPPHHVAFTIVESDGRARDISYAELAERSRRLASALHSLGIGPGDRVATLMTKSAELVTAILAIWRCGAVYVPLFTAFAAPAVAMRLGASAVKATFVDADQHAKLGTEAGRAIVTGGPPRDGDLALDALLRHEPQAVAWRGGGDAPFIHLFTSGTTGEPKAVVIPIRALASFVAYAEFGLDVRPDDVFWNAADPGWAYGLYYAICAPLAAGRRSILLRAPFSPTLTYDILERLEVTNFAAAPTVFRAMRAAGRPRSTALRLRRCSSAGEPLGADIVTWAMDALGVPVHDHYGQTEHGMVAANGHHPGVAAPLRPGSLGRALPGWKLAILEPLEDVPVEPGRTGRVAIDVAQSALVWFASYADAPERTAERFVAGGRYYLTGDAGSMDADGYVFFSARDDDVIIMAGYRIGPFDIESVLERHPAVAEAAVVGMPDDVRGEVVEAFVVLRPGSAGTPDLASELQRHVKTGYAAHAYPRAVHFVSDLPKTPSGKIQRFLLRAATRAARERISP